VVDRQEEGVEEGVQVQEEQETVANVVGVGTAVWDYVGGFHLLSFRQACRPYQGSRFGVCWG
jgi:hypothetical protein